ncbi:glutamate synthase-related protein, partial [Staphylococcus aureus]|uniref:glutamate synthase-related protein n=1 Tax=Staphylococcus aureus TaxID=1280 RepID=UPI0037DA49A6
MLPALPPAPPDAALAVPFVSPPGVGPLASGVAPAFAAPLVLRGSAGGPGASPPPRLPPAGVPWALGFAAPPPPFPLPAFLLRVPFSPAGPFFPGPAVASACALGAAAFGFAPAPFVVLGCLLLRV